VRSVVPAKINCLVKRRLKQRLTVTAIPIRRRHSRDVMFMFGCRCRASVASLSVSVSLHADRCLLCDVCKHDAFSPLYFINTMVITTLYIMHADLLRYVLHCAF